MYVSNTVNPVTQVADVAVNIASITLTCSISLKEIGIHKRHVPKIIIIKKLETINLTGDISFKLFNLAASLNFISIPVFLPILSHPFYVFIIF